MPLRSGTFTIVDSLPHPEPYYKTIVEFVKLVAQQMGDLKGTLLATFFFLMKISRTWFNEQAGTNVQGCFYYLKSLDFICLREGAVP